MAAWPAYEDRWGVKWEGIGGGVEVWVLKTVQQREAAGVSRALAGSTDSRAGGVS